MYGVLCSPLFVPLINPLQDWAVSDINNGAEATAHLAELLRALADNNDTTDRAAAERIQAAGRE